MPTLLCTGCSSGLGLTTLSLLLDSLASSSSSSSPLRILAATRSPALSAAHSALSTRARTLGGDLDWITGIDLRDLPSVARFADQVKHRTDEVDCLFLNAGAWTSELRTVELQNGEVWAEEAVVNCFAQHYLAQLLLPLLEKAASRAARERTTPPRVVFTSSKLHESISSLDDLLPLLRPPSPSSSSPLPPTTTSTGKHRYAASKLAALLSAQSLKDDLAARRVGADVLAVSPGFVPSTALSRESPWAGRWLMRNVVARVAPFAVTEEEGAKRLLRALPPPFSLPRPSSSSSSSSSSAHPSSSGPSGDFDPLSALLLTRRANPTHHPLVFLSGPSTAAVEEVAKEGNLSAALREVLPSAEGATGGEEEEGRRREGEKVRGVWAPSVEELEGAGGEEVD
ncbi:hypothetical protein JCM8097_008401 [Rhodosporidiobolus ruineniae]